MKESLLFEDNHLFIMNKKGGIPTQDDHSPTPSLTTLCKEWIKVRDHKPGNVFLEPIHRLDKPASGIVIFTKTRKALSRMQAAMRHGEINKEYTALVEGRIDQKEGILEDILIHDPFKARIAIPDEKGGKRALLHYRVLEERENTTLLSIDLKTGRYHQIRIQWASRGHPICGDSKYGSKMPFKTGGIALEHTKAIFPHPITKERIAITTRSCYL